MLWIQIHWILIRIQGYVIHFEKIFYKKLRRKKFKKIFFLNNKKEIFFQLVRSLNCEFLSSTLPFLALIYRYPIFTCVDPDPQCSWLRIQFGSRSTTSVCSEKVKYIDLRFWAWTAAWSSSPRVPSTWHPWRRGGAWWPPPHRGPVSQGKKLSVVHHIAVMKWECELTGTGRFIECYRVSYKWF